MSHKRHHGLSLSPTLHLLVILPSLAIATPVFSQTSSQSNAQIAQTQEVTTLFVNSQIGSDRPEYGNSQAPFKTITYALSRLKQGQTAIIQLANGSYNSATGERFPLRLPENVTLRGNEANKGRDVILLGGGAWRVGTGMPQNVAIAFSDRSELRGVTISNRNPRGYGIWIENANPVVANSTFLDNQQDGGMITGKSNAIITGNQFFRNGTSGLAIAGTATPDIRGNLFQQTTFGISIRQDAAPQITENTFTQNQNGILIQANAKPILRGNAIVNNRGYGLTISDLAQPDLGKPNDDGNNVFQTNGIFDIQNGSRNAIAVIGNQLDSRRVKGNLQLSNLRPPTNPFANKVPSSNRLANNSVNTSSNSVNTGDRFANLNQQLEQTIANRSISSINVIPINPSQNTGSFTTNNQITNQNAQSGNNFWYQPVSSVIIRISPQAGAFPTNPEISANLRPVRSAPPSGEPVNQPIQIAPLANTNFTPQNPPRYRVVVPVGSANEVAKVRQIVPSSFASKLNGYLVVQIGAYSDRNVAEVQVSRLAQRGLSARIESIQRP